MKCKLKHNDVFGLPDDRKVMITVGEMKQNFEREFNERATDLFESVKRDITAQFMATCCCELNKEFGFGKDRLNRFKNGVECLFVAMSQSGIGGKAFDTQTCIDYMRDMYGIDVDAKEV